MDIFYTDVKNALDNIADATEQINQWIRPPRCAIERKECLEALEDVRKMIDPNGGLTVWARRLRARIASLRELFKEELDVGEGIAEEQDNRAPSVDSKTFVGRLLPQNDIFSELLESVYKNERVCAFLNEMKRSLSKKQRELRAVVLPKLLLTENTEDNCVIEWIFKHFRLYFSFSEKEGDYCGEVVNDLENGYYRNVVRKMEVGRFPEIAEAEVDYATTLERERLYER